MTEERQFASSLARGAVDRALDLGPVDEALEIFADVLLHSGGLHRHRLLVVAIRGGVGDVERLAGVLGRVIGDDKRRRTGVDIA